METLKIVLYIVGGYFTLGFLTLLTRILTHKEILLQQSFNWMEYKGGSYGNEIIFYKYKYFDYYIRKEIIDCYNKSENHPGYKKFEKDYNALLKEIGISDSQVKYKWKRWK